MVCSHSKIKNKAVTPPPVTSDIMGILFIACFFNWQKWILPSSLRQRWNVLKEHQGLKVESQQRHYMNRLFTKWPSHRTTLPKGTRHQERRPMGSQVRVHPWVPHWRQKEGLVFHMPEIKTSTIPRKCHTVENSQEEILATQKRGLMRVHHKWPMAAVLG